MSTLETEFLGLIEFMVEDEEYVFRPLEMAGEGNICTTVDPSR